ncbi:uncharacterized protein LOC115888820 isoform X2 [Sitophilus oryzae]|uniref:Uncharacterized protein LOC115888820 isoform X2 n=1 Tax=Sitophilus oryzae TaxID=7048 RepID=A0A6J2YP22_SITOR|nr:uncharacterized protein LOC115888820 isoform X2 [Sitophilus oryzae]
MGFVCCVPGCNNTNKENVQMHRFPNDQQLCDLWLSTIGRLDLKVKPLERIRAVYRICNVHFGPESAYIGSRNKSLIKKDAVPTQLLVNTIQLEKLFTKSANSTKMKDPLNNDGADQQLSTSTDEYTNHQEIPDTATGETRTVLDPITDPIGPLTKPRVTCSKQNPIAADEQQHAIEQLLISQSEPPNLNEIFKQEILEVEFENVEPPRKKVRRTKSQANEEACLLNLDAESTASIAESLKEFTETYKRNSTASLKLKYYELFQTFDGFETFLDSV